MRRGTSTHAGGCGGISNGGHAASVAERIPHVVIRSRRLDGGGGGGGRARAGLVRGELGEVVQVDVVLGSRGRGSHYELESNPVWPLRIFKVRGRTLSITKTRAEAKNVLGAGQRNVAASEVAVVHRVEGQCCGLALDVCCLAATVQIAP